MGSLVQKWQAIFAIYFQDGLAYKASAVIWILTDVVTAVTMPLVWATASAATNGPINGFRTGDFVLYYLCLLLMNNFITSHIMWDLASEIREGIFTVALVRPISYYQVSFFRNLAWRVFRILLFVPIFLLLLFLYRGYLTGEHVYISFPFVITVILGHLVSFTFVMMMSMLALFTQEVFSIFELYYVPLIFLSGQLVPIAMLPNWAQSVARALPFYFTTGAPTEILIGRVQGDAIYQCMGMQIIWIVVAYAASKALWYKGLRHYTAVGM
ncbi:MAG TPA: ABC-2 family transporter protein [Fimbriimonadaceae bacterium]|jgi:ABC-2 type transport system permease protein